jgi:MFS family permease
MGLFRTFGGIGSLVGAILLGGVADLSSFAWSLGVDAILLIAAALGMMLLVRETAGGERPRGDPILAFPLVRAERGRLDIEGGSIPNQMSFRTK